MRRLVMVLAVAGVVWAACGDTPADPPTSLEGAWFGFLQPAARVQLRITETGDGLTAQFDDIDGGVMGIPVDEITAEGPTMSLRIDVLEARGTFTLRNDHLEGEMVIGEKNLPVALVRRDAPFEFKRPQEPVAPHPYRVEEISFSNPTGGFDLAGTVTIPDGPGPFPAVVLVSGSGPQDRDEQVAGHRPFLVLADHLARAGIMSLRYDDRGFGASGGSREDATTADLATDAAAAFGFLKDRPESGRAGIIGHSEGGLIAPIVATADPGVDFIVMLAGPGMPGADVLIAQTALVMEAEGVKPEVHRWQMQWITAAVEVAASDLDDGSAAAEMAALIEPSLADLPEELAGVVTADQLTEAGEIYLSPWMRDFLRLDPAPTLRRVGVPVLALFGENDLQVPPEENAAAVEGALASGIAPEYAVEIVPGVNHLFQHSDTGKVSEYAELTETIAPEVLERVSTWILGSVAG